MLDDPCAFVKAKQRGHAIDAQVGELGSYARVVQPGAHRVGTEMGDVAGNLRGAPVVVDRDVPHGAPVVSFLAVVNHHVHVITGPQRFDPDVERRSERRFGAAVGGEVAGADEPVVAGDLSPAQLFWIIKNGINMTGMPSFGLIEVPDQEIWTIVAFVKKLPSVSEADFKAWTAKP